MNHNKKNIPQVLNYNLAPKEHKKKKKQKYKIMRKTLLLWMNFFLLLQTDR